MVKKMQFKKNIFLYYFLILLNVICFVFLLYFSINYIGCYVNSFCNKYFYENICFYFFPLFIMIISLLTMRVRHIKISSSVFYVYIRRNTIMPHISTSLFFHPAKETIKQIENNLITAANNLPKGTTIKICSALCLRRNMVLNNFTPKESNCVDGFLRRRTYLLYSIISFYMNYFKCNDIDSAKIILKKRKKRAKNFNVTWIKTI